MNCHDFKTVVGELADARLIDAATREAGLKHAAACVECAARLMHERSISATLRVVARAETEEAPARVKQSLLAAFAEQQKTAEAVPVPAVVVELSSRRAKGWGIAIAAAAAVVLISLSLPSLLRVSPDSSQVPPPYMSAATTVTTVAPTPTVGEAISTPPIVVKDITPRHSAKRVNANARRNANVSRGDAPDRYETVAQNVGNDYLPLTYLDPATALETGTVVRVRLSRSALMSLGVPVNSERSGDFVKAEVVLGDDGVARAIRLVR
jgi:hypothetical protein